MSAYDPRREAYLEGEISRLQEDKLTALQNVRKTTGVEKVAVLDHFLKLDREQKVHESELDKMLADD